MSVPSWVSVGQVLVAINGHKDVPVDGPVQVVLPVSKFEVLDITIHLAIVSIPGLKGHFYIEGVDLEEGWNVVSQDSLIDIKTLVPGAKLIDSSGKLYLVSALVGEQVVMRPATPTHGTLYLEGPVRRPLSEVLETMRPESAAKVRTPRSEFGVVKPPQWARSRVDIQKRSSGETFRILDTPDRGVCRLQPTIWTCPQAGENGTPKVDPIWIAIPTVSLQDEYDVLDSDGYPQDHGKCPQCGKQGKANRVESPARFYECDDKHSWGYTYADKGKGLPLKNRFTMLDD